MNHGTGRYSCCAKYAKTDHSEATQAARPRAGQGAVHLDGFGQLNEPDAPALPVLRERVAVPAAVGVVLACAVPARHS